MTVEVKPSLIEYMAIREGEKHTDAPIPIIAMTAHTMQGDRERCLAADMDDYISKPIKTGELKAALDRVLQRAGDLNAPEAGLPIGLSSALIDLVRVFLEYYPQAIAELQAAVAATDAAGVERLAHSLRGAVSILGAWTAFPLAQERESTGRQAQLDAASVMLQQLEEALERLKTLTTEPGWEDHLSSPATLP